MGGGWGSGGWLGGLVAGPGGRVGLGLVVLVAGVVWLGGWGYGHCDFNCRSARAPAPGGQAPAPGRQAGLQKLVGPGGGGLGLPSLRCLGTGSFGWDIALRGTGFAGLSGGRFLRGAGHCPSGYCPSGWVCVVRTFWVGFVVFGGSFVACAPQACTVYLIGERFSGRLAQGVRYERTRNAR